MYEMMHGFLEAFVRYCILGFEFVGVLVLVASGIQGIIHYFKHDPRLRLSLAEGMALALEFKLGSEILRTVIVRETSELLFVGGIIILRAALTLLIHWEIKNEASTEETEKAAGEEKSEALELKKTKAALAQKESLLDQVLDKRFGNLKECPDTSDAVRQHAAPPAGENHDKPPEC